MEITTQNDAKIIQKQLDELHLSLSNSNYQAALLLNKNLLKKFPLALHLKCNLALIQYNMERYQEATSNLNFAVSSGYTNSQVLKFYLITLNLTGDLSQIRELLKTHFDSASEYSDIIEPLLAKSKNKFFISKKWDFIKPFDFMKLSEPGKIKLRAFYRKNSLAEKSIIYRKLADYFPFDDNILYEHGLIDFEAKNFESAVALFKSTVAINPSSTKAHLILASTYNELNEHELAIQLLRELSTRNQAPEIFNNLGNSYLKNNQQKKAFEQYYRAIELSGNKPVFIRNFIKACKEIKNPKKAIIYLECLKNDSELHSDLYYDLGVLYEHDGQLSSAIEIYSRKLTDSKSFSPAISNLMALHLQLRHTTLNKPDFSHNLPISPSLDRSPVCRILNAIKFFLDQKHDLCSDQLTLFKKTKKEFFLELAKSDQKFCIGYFHLLTKLTKNHYYISRKVENVIYHFSESHCLSFSGYVFTLYGVQYKISSRICIGGKAFHFAQHQQNKFKKIVFQNLKSLDEGSLALFSFGEIDCRMDEGILLAFAKGEQTLDELIKLTSFGYVNWIYHTCSDLAITPLITTVPAPNYMNSFSDEDNRRRAYVVKRYNDHIIELSKKFKIKFLDIYFHTVDDNGFSNSKFHIDQFHISSSVLDHLY